MITPSPARQAGVVTGQPTVWTPAHTLRAALGLLWLFDGLLQLQPFMFTRGFADQIIAPAGEAQPWFVSYPVSRAAAVIGAHPIMWDSLFAVAQVGIGVLILVPRTVRTGLAASVVWGIGVWYFGEGLGGLASGHADLLTGAPGAALLYVVLAAALWPGEGGEDRIATWLPLAWAVLWIGSAVLQLLPGQNTGADLAGELADGADSGPVWISGLGHGLGGFAQSSGFLVVAMIVTAEVWVGINALASGRLRRTSALLGAAIALGCWLTCQACGDLTTGQATDPGTAPLVILLALALIAPASGRWSPVVRRRHPQVGPHGW